MEVISPYLIELLLYYVNEKKMQKDAADALLKTTIQSSLISPHANIIKASVRQSRKLHLKLYWHYHFCLWNISVECMGKIITLVYSPAVAEHKNIHCSEIISWKLYQNFHTPPALVEKKNLESHFFFWCRYRSLKLTCLFMARISWNFAGKCVFSCMF